MKILLSILAVLLWLAGCAVVLEGNMAGAP
jgi:uncharacterized protein YceK